MAKFAKDVGIEFSAEDACAAFSFAKQDHLTAVCAILCKLAPNPPQVLLLEGGLESERLSLARYWAALQHCEFPIEDETGYFKPCTQCSACMHIGADMFMDVLVYDGRISNAEDEENPGPIRALSKDNVVDIKSRVADTTHSGKKRVVLMNGIEMKRTFAANTLLKVLEEPSPTTIFVLLAPQREQLLATLVSRSWVLTLPWPKTHDIPAELNVWEQSLASFLEDGRKLWSLTSSKGAVDQNLAIQIVLLCQKCLLPALATQQSLSPLSQCFAHLNPTLQLKLVQHLDAAQESLYFNVNPARVLEALAAQMFILYKQR